MSPLSFDKQGKPFAFQRCTKMLLVRLFRNPSARGTCCQVLGSDGQALYVDPEIDYAEFRRTVGQVPGLYRLDQCDEDGNQLEDAQPAYVSIDVPRNAQNADTNTGDVNPRSQSQRPSFATRQIATTTMTMTMATSSKSSRSPRAR